MAGTGTTKRHPLVEDYLARVEQAAAKLPRGQRQALIADTTSYVDQAIKPDASAIEVRGMLSALGTPEDLVAQDRPKAVAQPDSLEIPAITLLALGGLFIGIGWFVGVYLLWKSRVFSLSDKLIGTLLWPGGLASAMIVAIVVGISGLPVAPLLAVVILAVPLLVAWHLYRRVPRD